MSLFQWCPLREVPLYGGGFRNLEKGVQPLVCKVPPPPNFGVAMPTSGHMNAFLTRNYCLT